MILLVVCGKRCQRLLSIRAEQDVILHAGKQAEDTSIFIRCKMLRHPPRNPQREMRFLVALREQADVLHDTAESVICHEAGLCP